MSIESRAARASRSIQAAVAGVQPAGMAAVTRRHRFGWAAAVAFVGVLAGTSIALASMLPGTADDEIASPPTTIPPAETTLPAEPGPPIVVPPAGEDEAPEIEVALVEEPEDRTALAGWDHWGYGIEGWGTTTTTEPVAVTAHQSKGSSSSGTPYEKVYGTAPPGTEIVITSPYGSAEGTAGENGEFLIEVYFTNPPKGEWFPITVQIGEETFSFSFKWTYTTQTSVTAKQYYGPEHEHRYDKVYGTAPPGTHVLATSEYGSSDLEVGESGEYYLKIHFNESLPANEWITWRAILKDPSGNVLLQKTFEFKWVPEDHEITLDRCVYPNVSADPWQKVCGWAPEGSFVDIVSEYGSTEGPANGDFHLKIHFDESLPANEWITWTARIWIDGEIVEQKTFEFKWEPVYDPTAAQKWGPVSGEPSEKIYGTAPPGSEVSAASPYGSAAMAVGGSGSYALVIDFNSPPENEAFQISVTITEDGTPILTETFSFTYAPE